MYKEREHRIIGIHWQSNDIKNIVLEAAHDVQSQPIAFDCQANCELRIQCDATPSWLEMGSRYRRKLKVRFLSPHHASVLASPILLIIIPPIDHWHASKDVINTRSDCWLNTIQRFRDLTQQIITCALFVNQAFETETRQILPIHTWLGRIGPDIIMCIFQDLGSVGAFGCHGLLHINEWTHGPNRCRYCSYNRSNWPHSI